MRTANLPLKSVAIPTEHGGWGFTLEPILLGLLYLAFVWKPLPHPFLALIGVALLHPLLKKPYPWPGIGFLLLGLLLLWH